ncbi:hypothetical protein [Streptomyces sp. A2-16]|uniref:hypothetical protein n=1 Tax=Streptomyces sp. A2-16 TaxID=2781734 RepID=UPI0020131383|nr:hypothetical protein [Streptomyces sp. A2-16]
MQYACQLIPKYLSGHRDVAGDLFDVVYYRQAPLGLTVKGRMVGLGFGMWISVVIGDPGVNDDRQF